MRIAIIGTGYVGLVTGTCLADLGNQIICVDIDKNKIKKMQKGVSPIYEPGLETVMKKNIKNKRLTFTADIGRAARASQLIFIAVGTPSKENGEADLQYVRAAAKDIGQALEKLPKSRRDLRVIINKSTVPIGTGDLVSQIIKKYYDGPFEVVSNPEFLREGQAVNDFFRPDRIVVGGQNDQAIKLLKKLYKPLGCPVLTTDVKTAEMIKYASNAFLATSISFINSIAGLCEKIGADVEQVSQGMKLDKRIGKKAFLNAGIGYGGSCFPKDVKALVSIASRNFSQFQILEAVEAVNAKQKESVIAKLGLLLPNLKDKKIALWGLAFKPETDDIREAPAIIIAQKLQALGAKLHVFDPVASPNAKKVLKNVRYFDKPLSACRGAHALIIATEWPEFREISAAKIKEVLVEPNVIDGRNVFQPAAMLQAGLNYISIGRQMLEPRVSIIIPVSQINTHIFESVPEIMALDYQNFEVLILPDRFRQREVEDLVETWGEKLRFIPTGKKGPAEKRDLALAYATGEVLAFLDDDAFPERDWLKNAIRHFRNPRCAAVGGPALTPPKSSFWQKVSAAVFESFLGGGLARRRYLPIGEIQKVDDWPSVNLLVKRDAFEAVGGFDTAFWPGEDTKLCLDITQKLGQEIVYDPQVQVYHHRRKTLLGHLRQIGSYGLHRGYFAKRYPKTSLRLSYFMPTLFVLYFLSAVVVAFFIKAHPWLTFYLLPLGLYVLGLAFDGVNFARRYRNPLVGLLALPTIFLTHCYYGVRLIQGLLTKELVR